MSAPSDSLGKDARALIQAARGGDDVPAEERQRLLEVFARNASPAQQSRAGGAPAPLRRARRSRAPQLSWAVAALVLTGSLAALAQHQGLFERLGALLDAPSALPAAPSAAARPPVPRSQEAAPVLPQPVLPQPVLPQPALLPPGPEQRTPPADPERAVPAEPAPVSARKSPASLRSAPPRSAPPRSALASALPDTIDPEELDLIAAARTALAERRYETARQRAERHAQRFPQGAFSEEREAILALSDCRSQRGTERGQRFVRERPGALLSERVRRDCGLDSNLVPSEREPGTH